MTDENKSPKESFFAKGNRKLAVFAIGSVLAVSTAFGVQAFSESKPYQHYKVEAKWGGGGWGRHHGRGHGFMQMSDEEMQSRIERMVKHAAIEIDATDDQQDRIIALLTGAVKEIKPLAENMRGSRKELHELLSAETIDRAALESLRTKRLSEFDSASKKLVDTVASVAEVLTAEQRQQLEERIKEFRSFRKGRRHD